MFGPVTKQTRVRSSRCRSFGTAPRPSRRRDGRRGDCGRYRAPRNAPCDHAPVAAGLLRKDRRDGGTRARRRFWKRRFRRCDRVVACDVRIIGHRRRNGEQVRHHHRRWGRARCGRRVVRSASQRHQGQHPRRSTVTETLMVTDHGQRYPLTSYACKEKFEYLTWSA
jgi:hypothetical protein